MSLPKRVWPLALIVLAAALSPLLAEDPKPAAEPKAAPAPAPAAAPAPAPVAINAPVVNKATIELDDKSKANGEVKFVFTPTGGAATEIRVTVAAKSDANDVAKSVEKEFKVAVGANYEVDRGGKKVEIQGKKKATFQLVISSQNAPGLSVRIK